MPLRRRVLCPQVSAHAGRHPSARLLPRIVPLSPSSLDAWLQCPRLFLDRHVFQLPESDSTPPTDRGNLVHAILRFVHEKGSCHDTAHVSEVLEAHGLNDDVNRGFVDRHARRCPIGAAREAHEHTVARFHRIPPPMFMATARIDAIWGFDDLVDARDYKTGALFVDRVADDPRARLQAWILAHSRHLRGRRLRIRYEYLSPDVDDDPDPFEPSADDLDEIEEQLRTTVTSIWESDWRGNPDETVCRRCAYHSICPDSAAPSEPTWPAPPAAEGREAGR